MIVKELQPSDYRMRKLVGTLGLILPLLLPIAEGEFLSSISHYYYKSLSSIFFIVILSSFGLFLISYKGYKIDKTTEKISDDIITNIGGFAALIVVLIPTSCSGSTSSFIEAFCAIEKWPLLGHNGYWLNIVHLVSAGIFILSMGWMSKYKFTRSDKDPNIRLYRICGNLVFAAVGLIVFFIILERLEVNFPLKDYYVYIFETMAVIPFGISWLVKGEVISDVKDLMKMILGKSESEKTLK